ncbi:hypothetical protein T492DRAFT_917595, partial [Pavlovales sp. CCMP2436]
MDAVVCVAAGVLIAKLWRGVLATGPLKAPVERPQSLVCQCLMDEDDEDKVVLERAVYAQVKHLLSADVLLFAKNLCENFISNEDGTEISTYLSALSGIEKGALYHMLAFCESPPNDPDSPVVHEPVSLAHIPVDGYLSRPASTASRPHLAVLEMRHHSTVALCALILGHTPVRNSPRLSMLILEDDFCPRAVERVYRPSLERWTDAIEIALMSSTPKFLISNHTHRMLSQGALFRLSSTDDTHALPLQMYHFVYLIKSNSALQYMCDEDMWYCVVAHVHFLDYGPRCTTFLSTISCMLMTALGRDVHKVVLGGNNVHAAVLMTGNQMWIPAKTWSAGFAKLINALIEKNGPDQFNGWSSCWAKIFNAFADRCTTCAHIYIFIYICFLSLPHCAMLPLSIPRGLRSTPHCGSMQSDGDRRRLRLLLMTHGESTTDGRINILLI